MFKNIIFFLIILSFWFIGIIFFPINMGFFNTLNILPITINFTVYSVLLKISFIF